MLMESLSNCRRNIRSVKCKILVTSRSKLEGYMIVYLLMSFTCPSILIST